MIEKNGYVKKLAILFFVGVFIGIIVSFVMQNYYKDSYYTYFGGAAKQLISGKIHYGFLFFKTIKRVLIPYLFILVLSMSPAYLPYCFVYMIYIGTRVGYFMGSLFMTYQIRGFLYGILYGMPQILIYTPAMLMLMYLGYQENENLQKKKSLPEKLVPLFMILVLVLVGASLETFVNSFIMRKTIFLVS
ncbi:MAG: stage II sporulation protein M [Velocimicrobium sp.]